MSDHTIIAITGAVVGLCVACLFGMHCAPSQGAATPTAVFGMVTELQACVDPEAGIVAEEACVTRVNERWCGPNGIFRDSGACSTLSTPPTLLDAGRPEASR